MPEKKPEADKGDIVRHLTHITQRWHELNQPCLLEIVHLAEGTQPRVSHFSPDEMGISLAADHITSMNATERNSYVTVNPVDANNKPTGGKRANASQIVASFFHWADADDGEAAQRIKNFVGPQRTFHVLTGTEPTPRPHAYWELEEPTRNMPAWTATQSAIAASLGTDPSVVDPPRIMRIAGTVNWPSEKKRAKGYVAETTRLKIFEDRPPISSERMAAAFGSGRRPSDKHTSGFEFDAGDGKSSEDYAEILQRARTDGTKHTGVRDLTASLAAQGVSQRLCEAIVRQTCPVWDEGVESLIRTAYEKYYQQPSARDPDTFSAPTGTWAVQPSADFVSDFVAPEYLIDGIVQRGRLYTLTAPTGTGKTGVTMYAAAAISAGRQFCGLETEKGAVLYLAGENPDDVRARWIAAQEVYGIDGADVYFIASTFSMRADAARLQEEIAKIPNLVLVVVDTFAAYYDGDDGNNNAQVLDFTRATLRKITNMTSRPTVITPAHPIKNARANELSPMGGSALLNEVDGNLTLWRRDDLITMHWQGKHRGADFEAVQFELKPHTSPVLTDRNGRPMPTVAVHPVLELRRRELMAEAMSQEDSLLFAIRDNPTASIPDLCAAIGMLNEKGEAKKSSMHRMIQRLAETGLVRFKRGGKKVLTQAGKEAVEDIENGVELPGDEL